LNFTKKKQKMSLHPQRSRVEVTDSIENENASNQEVVVAVEDVGEAFVEEEALKKKIQARRSVQKMKTQNVM